MVSPVVALIRGLLWYFYIPFLQSKYFEATDSCFLVHTAHDAVHKMIKLKI